MLRSLVLILLIVNAAFYAWSQGWLNQVVGVQPDAQHEPQRLAQQIKADKIKVATPPAEGVAASASAASASQAASTPAPEAGGAASDAASSADSAASSPLASSAQADGLCLEAGPFNAAEFPVVESVLKPILPSGSWLAHAVAIQGLWLVYMGPYAEGDMLERKQAELRRIKGLNFEEVRTPVSLAQGISLGRYNRQEDAQAGLDVLRSRGIRTARIVNIRPDMDVQVVRVARATARMQVSLAGLKMPQGKGFTPCRS